MAIDDPVAIAIQQARDDAAERSYLPSRLIRLGASGALEAALVQFPFVSQIMTTLVAGSPIRFEERFLVVAEELEKQQKRIECKIPDTGYYRSEEFQTLIGLILERLHTTHDREKLKMFGHALANSGCSDFRDDDKEQIIRVLRDLSPHELEALSDDRLKLDVSPAKPIEYSSAEIARFSRIASMGLVHDRRISGFDGGPGVGRDRIYSITDFGVAFLRFVSEGGSESGTGDSWPSSSDARR
ncbi:MAG: hypothetical protein ACLPWF_23785 [Bryobacteraceae bacterium]